MIKTDILIIGGGLTGLTLQYLLQEEGHHSIILEARERVGGRIYTAKTPSGVLVDMGATWLGRKHRQLIDLLDTVGVERFPQRLGKTAIYEPISTSPFQLVTLPENDEPSFRIKGGSSAIINQLAQNINPDSIYTGLRANAIREKDVQLIVETDSETFEAKYVVSTLPPKLLKENISFEPGLPAELIEIMNETHTWMGEAIKFSLIFEAPFWREEGSSGTVFSNVGPIPELYDHSNYQDNLYALKGFLNSSYFMLSKEERLANILKQLKRYFGTAVEAFTEYKELIWAKEVYTYVEYEQPILPHQHNGHNIYRKPYFHNKLFIAGSETASVFPGYMEGAVNSARFVKEQLEKYLN